MKLVSIALAILLLAAPTRARADDAGTDFAAQAKVLFRIAACGSTDAIDAKYPRKAIDRHCKRMEDRYAVYKKKWVDKARTFLATVVPSQKPTSVVYPFGGGDLVTALTVFPDASTYTTISLEAAGDVRVIDQMSKAQLGRELDRWGQDIDHLYRSAWSATKQLEALSHSHFPGEICFTLAALVVHGYVPTSLRYFTLADDGTIQYLTDAQLDELAAEIAQGAGARKKAHKKAKHFWYEQTSAYANVEIQFVPADNPSATPKVFRHMVANLDNDHMDKDGRLLTFLASQGKPAAMTKAASYLLWYDDFSTIRGWLLDHMAYMVSDDSGIPPDDAKQKGFEEIPFGLFTGPFFTLHDTSNIHAQMKKLWKSSPKRDMPIRFGYPDADKVHGHLLITQPASCAGKVPC
jgi:hypothetical protein